MAYRRLPNTDNARLIAITSLNNLLLGDDLLLDRHHKTIRGLNAIFGNLLNEREKLVKERTRLNKAKKEVLIQLRLYVSHFFQVFNFAIDRNDIPKSCRLFFRLSANTGNIPALTKEADVVGWANNIVVGEQERIKEGIETISHPKYTRIKELKEETETILAKQKEIELVLLNCQKEIAKKRKKVDTFIKQVWNEIEFQFINEPIEIKRKKAAQYGVAYVI